MGRTSERNSGKITRAVFEAVEKRLMLAAEVVMPGVAPTADSDIDTIVNFDGDVVFAGVGYGGGYGSEAMDGIWRSDGTQAGTAQIYDGTPSSLATMGNALYFGADGALYRSAGAAGDAVKLTPAGATFAGAMVTAANRLYFRATDSAHGTELWTSDGTAAGTHLISDYTPGPNSSINHSFATVGDSLFFISGATYETRKMYKTDGTAAGTVELLNIEYFGSTAVIGSTLYFATYEEVWKTNGTAAGTELVADFSGTFGYGPDDLANVNGTLFFTATDPTHGRQLFKSDGTTAGTVRVGGTVNYGGGYGSPHDIVAFNGDAYFFNTSGYGDAPELWKSNGTEAGTMRVKEFGVHAHDDVLGIQVVNNVLYFMDQNDDGFSAIWKSDGTNAGTVKVNTGQTTIAGFMPFSVSGTNVFYIADDGASGDELWTTDDTPGGAHVVIDLSLRSPTNPEPSLHQGPNGTIIVREDSIHGSEPWFIDGTGSPALLKDLNTKPGNFSSSSGSVTVGGITYFGGSESVYGTELWKTDGTAAGTVLLKDINPGGASSWPTQLINVNGTIFFDAWTDQHGDELWKSDGTAAGTVLVKDIYPGANSSVIDAMFVLNGLLYFAATDGVNGHELWKTDGTEAGTVMVVDLNPAGDADIWGLHGPVNGKMVFSSYIDGVDTLYVSDGTAAGTTVLADGVYMDDTSVVVGGTLYFDGWTEASGFELWKTDGTPAGTQQVLELGPGDENSDITRMLNVGGTLYFLNDDKLYRSNGTVAGTVEALPGVGNYADIVAIGSSIYYSTYTPDTGSQLYRTDGTLAGTVTLTSFAPGGNSPQYLTPIGSLLYFNANDGVNGEELWRTDGTPAGTAVFKDIAPGAGSSYPAGLEAAGNKLFFSAVDSDGPSWRPWMTDGTLAGTVRLDPSIANGSSSPTGFASGGGYSWFFASDGTGVQVMRSDGTAAGTVAVADFPGMGLYGFSNLTYVDGAAYFLFGFYSLYKTDSSPQGASLVAEVGNGWSPQSMTASGGKLYFTLFNSTNREEVWVSDGTAAGTKMVKDVSPLLTYTPHDLIDLNGILYFVSDDGVNGEELWRTDGTTAGTYMVKNINPGSAASAPAGLRRVGNSLYFTATDGSSGRELWKTDGTPAGTVLALDLAAGPASSNPRQITQVGSSMYFVADVDGVVKLFKSDGTSGETHAIFQVAASANADDEIAHLTNVNGVLFFAADDGAHGRELWMTDGTAGGTVMVDDIASGARGSYPHGIVAGDGHALFYAADGSGGVSIYKAAVPTDGVFASHDAAYSITGPAGAKTLTLTSGSLSISPSLFTSAYGDVIINQSGGEIFINAPQKIAALNLSGGAAVEMGTHLAINDALVGAWNGVAYSGVTGWVKNGNIRMPNPPTTPPPSQAFVTLGVARASQALGISGSETKLWNGLVVDPDAVLISYTFTGDANLDGIIDGDDFFWIDNGFGNNLKGYDNGDFNLDGRVDADDYWLIDSNYSKAQTPLAAASAVGFELPVTPLASDGPSAYKRLIEDEATQVAASPGAT